jgi:hypothetical protein
MKQQEPRSAQNQLNRKFVIRKLLHLSFISAHACTGMSKLTIKSAMSGQTASSEKGIV